MRDNASRITHAPVFHTLALLLLVLLPILSATGARADVYGRLHITVKSAATGAPLPGADITIHDPTNVNPDIPLTTDQTGSALSPPLLNHAWQVTTALVTFNTDIRTVTVAPDTTTEVSVVLTKQTISTGSSKITIHGAPSNATTIASVRNQTFIAKTPSGNGNPQSLDNLLITNPGMVQSTNNQVHPRGEHASTTIDIDGVELPDATIGRGGQFLSPETLQSAQILTGAYAPEYGSEVAAVLNLTLRQGTIDPFTDFGVTGGSFGTWDGDLTLGGQSGQPLIVGDFDGPKDLRYFLDLNYRNTDDALEPPQPDPQDAHNEQTASTLLGNFDYIAGKNDDFNLVLNTTPADTEVANRTGLSDYYIPVGQGYGYGGARNANGYLPGWNAANSTGAPLGAYFGGNQFVPTNGTGGIVSQEGMGQDDWQYDNNTFGLLNYRHTFNATTTGLVSFAQTQSVTQLRNDNPANDILDDFNADGTLTTTDNSIEFNPDMNRIYNQSQVQGSVTKTESTHTFKAGVIYDDQTGTEAYQFTPQSQLALDALANIYAFAPGYTYAPGQTITNNPFLPTGVKNSTTGAVDALGNPVVTLAGPGEAFPTVDVSKNGYYGAAYIQDTWQESTRFTMNYGFRYDIYHQSQTVNNGVGYTSSSSLTDGVLSPRLNTAYILGGGSILRLSYDHLFTQPPLAQGAIVGFSIKPETWDQYEGSVEKQFSPTQSAKIDYYYKNIRNQDDTGILIPFTQIGALTTLNYQYASVHGLELSYNLNPRNGIGTGAYVAYTYSVAKPGGLNEVGTPAPWINDHNQYDTLDTGIDYTWKSQAYATATFYYGSGEASSVLGPVSTAPGPEAEPSLDDGHTIPRTQLDLRLASSPRMLGFAGLQLDVINVFNSLAVDNFNSGFSGTRFQQARTYLLTMRAKF